MKANLTTNIVKTAMFVVLMAVSAYVQIPFPYLPLTFQFFTAAVAGLMLGSFWGMAAMLIYAAAGLLGLPVFAGFSGGFQYILKPSFGFIAGFPLVAAVSGLAADKNRMTMRILLLVGAVGGYAIGAAYEYATFIVNSYPSAVVVTEMLKLPLFFVKDIVIVLLAASVYSRTFKKREHKQTTSNNI